jgi:hypothetical protein
MHCLRGHEAVLVQLAMYVRMCIWSRSGTYPWDRLALWGSGSSGSDSGSDGVEAEEGVEASSGPRREWARQRSLSVSD